MEGIVTVTGAEDHAMVAVAYVLQNVDHTEMVKVYSKFVLVITLLALLNNTGPDVMDLFLWGVQMCLTNFFEEQTRPV